MIKVIVRTGINLKIDKTTGQVVFEVLAEDLSQPVKPGTPNGREKFPVAVVGDPGDAAILLAGPSIISAIRDMDIRAGKLREQLEAIGLDGKKEIKPLELVQSLQGQNFEEIVKLLSGTVQAIAQVVEAAEVFRKHANELHGLAKREVKKATSGLVVVEGGKVK